MILKPIIAKNPTEFRINYTFIYFHQLKFNVQTTKIIHGEKKKMRKDCQFYDSLKHFTQCPTNPICFAKRIHGTMERKKYTETNIIICNLLLIFRMKHSEIVMTNS